MTDAAGPPGSLYEIVFERVALDDALSERVRHLVLAAFTDDERFAETVAGDPPDLDPASGPAPSSVPDMYLSRISVTGFRGIGPTASLELHPGPGLTLVTGRNGSGKSTFAEAAELVVTGDNLRWQKDLSNAEDRRSGWCNHHTTGPREITVDVVAAGRSQGSTMRMGWTAESGLEDRDWTVQHHPGRRQPFDPAAWEGALAAHRPFLSYNELGRVLDRRPVDQYRELHRLLGLGEIDAARDRIAVARLERQRRADDARDRRKTLLAELESVQDPRAARARTVLGGRRAPDLAELSALTREDGPEGSAAALRAVRNLELPAVQDVDGALVTLEARSAEVVDGASDESAAAASVATLLDGALRHRRDHGDGPCPVCGAASLDSRWQDEAERELAVLRERSRSLDRARTEADRAARDVRALVGSVPAALRAAPSAVDAARLLELWTAWASAASVREPAALAEAVRLAHPPLVAELDAVRERARVELARLDEHWAPVARRLATLHDELEVVVAEAGILTELKRAEAWLKDVSGELRDERFAPIAERSQKIWDGLSGQSDVAVLGVRLSGTVKSGKMLVDVTVDGTEASALGVMSQGEMHALALSLFLPRATDAASPFRFLLIDDPVQAMDPAKVDALARTLAEHAGSRQVVVFTHDDRLAEAARRLDLGATILSVTRMRRSAVEVRRSSDPVARYLEDARAVAADPGLSVVARDQLVTIACRNAFDAAAIRRIQADRLGAGESHAALDELLHDVHSTRDRLALAIYGDVERRGDIERHFRSREWVGGVLRACLRAGHGGARPGEPHTFVGRVRELVEQVSR